MTSLANHKTCSATWLRGRAWHGQVLWRASFSLRVNEKVLPVDLIHKLLVDGGEQIGVGDYRPEKGGPFGTFRVLHWAEKIKPVATAAE